MSKPPSRDMYQALCVILPDHIEVRGQEAHKRASMRSDPELDVRELNFSDVIHEEIRINSFEVDDDMKSSWQGTDIEQEHQLNVGATNLDQTDALQTCSQNTTAGPPPSETPAGRVTRRMDVDERKKRSIREREYKSASRIDDLKVFRYAYLECARHVYLKNNAIHRDVPIADLDDRIRVFLDFDLSFASASHQALRLRSGTITFLARDIFDYTCTPTFLYHYDLESFLYVFLWHAYGYTQAKIPKKDVLRELRKDSWEGTGMMKFLFVLNGWRKLIPIDIPGEGYLRKQCLRLCCTYGEVTVKAQLAMLAAMKSELPFRGAKSTPLPDPNEERVVTFRLWLESVGFEDDAEVFPLIIEDVRE